MIPVPAVLGLVKVAGYGLTEHADGRKWNGALVSMVDNRRIRTGDLTCPGIDLDSWESACRAPLYANQWNRWLLIRSTYDGTTVSQIADRAAWFMNAVNQRIKGRIRHVKVHVQQLAPIKGWTPKTTIRNCAGGENANLKVSDNQPPYFSCFVEFVYRGDEHDMAWPAIKQAGEIAGKASVLVGNYNCPVKAAWLLDTVYSPSKDNVPAESTDSFLSPGYDNEANKIGLPSAPTIKIALTGVTVAALAIGAAYVVRAFK